MGKLLDKKYKTRADRRGSCSIRNTKQEQTDGEYKTRADRRGIQNKSRPTGNTKQEQTDGDAAR
ncbi:hypothetical protein T492DRAFT_1101467 [Pavlovales sp. CCMP2436]|nr:hypothetical protein T492DRAFT_1101467 [Pavlovales sp. CCMP2436]